MTDNAGPRIEYVEARRVLLDALTALSNPTSTQSS